MSVIINEENCVTAWETLSTLILNKGPQHNVMITISQPTDFGDLNELLKTKNPKKLDSTTSHIRQVVNTIFPYHLWELSPNRDALYTKYRSVYLKGKNRHWGTYFQRLISFDKHFNGGINQLENAIDALNGGSPQRHYIVFHLTSGNLDSNIRPMGAPCWHFGEITVNDDRSLNLVAVYRAQDYFNKALGNFIGLSKLLEFICEQTNRPIGSLIVHAIYAYNGGSKSNLVRLIN